MPPRIPKEVQYQAINEARRGVPEEALEDIGIKTPEIGSVSIPRIETPETETDTLVQDTTPVDSDRKAERMAEARSRLAAIPVEADIIVGNPELERRVRVVRERKREEKRTS